MKTGQHKTDVHGREVLLPTIGTRILRDGYEFVVNEVRLHRDICIIASILIRGISGSAEIGYYDYLKHERV